MTMLSEWFYAKELHEMIAIVFGGYFRGFFGIAFFILDIKEKRLAKEELKLFQDEDGIPRFVRASDKQIGLHNQ